jgi:protein MpaA
MTRSPLYVGDPRGATPSRNLLAIQGEFRGLLAGRFEEHNVGRLAYDGFDGDIFSYTAEGSGDKPWVFLFAGIHGDEPAGVLGLKDFLSLGDWSWLEDWNALILPVANPWGWVFAKRYNGQGIDLNRDFSAKNTQSTEARLILDFLQGRQAKLALDLHESISQAHYFYVYNGDSRSKVQEFHQTIPYPLDSGHKVSGMETREGILEVPAYIPFFLWLADRRPLANLFLDQTPWSFTVESSRQRPLAERRAYHRRALEYFLLGAQGD